ncbi:DUF871 domain-containing protein [Tractidigestivibacter montrealensis]|uniref:MupG family TIM beta-alpha barrel fold protein n=1 Tax=Tractidigestivibacter montrealensis TaxID=2972466 RepID=A0ABT1Z8N0_9ACTN|nr:MupG family TIM beta-alpha barrel fold protein [Tractidigestivibacter montrealensis]MCR9036563.1 MupG family TIM beta-alpha barrel fold protein [Tractidigestivibacter montrealensis]
MKRLGISIYPEKSDREQLLDYLERASAAGFSRIFSCLLSVKDSRENVMRDFSEINARAHELGFEVVLDCNPRIFDELGVSYRDLSFFRQIGADGIRLDMGFTGNEESLMTFNPEGLTVEVNMSNDVHYIDTIMDYQPDSTHLVGCHNFYPHNYSGLGLDFFRSCTRRFKSYGLQTAAFVTSQAPDTFGPWPVTDGLPTLEMHRHLPLRLQVEHYISMGGIDDVIISNCYPTQEELDSVARLPKNLVSFGVALVDGLPEVERSIVLDELHFNRGDVSENFIRSTQSRVKHRGHHFDVLNTPETIRRGDVVIESSEYGHYAGELQIARNDMKNSGMSNVVGHIPEEELFLIDTIKPWQKFRFHEANAS